MYMFDVKQSISNGVKLIYFANARIPTEKAHGSQIIKMCESFGDAGISLELILPTRKNNDYQGVDVYEHYKVKNNFQINKLSTSDPLFLLKFPVGTYIKLQTLLFGKSIYKYLKREKISLDTILYTRDQYLVPLLLKFSKNVVWEAHDLPVNKSQYARYWKRCSQVIAITQGLKDELVELGLNHENIFVAPDGVDLKIFGHVKDSQAELRQKLNLPQDKKIVLYAGHLYDWKGAQILAQAAAHIDKSAVVAFLGGTDSDIAKFKDQYSKQDNIKVLGRVEHYQVPDYLHAADVLVLPNSGKTQISAKYTSPLKLFEYMSAKKPIVASALPSIREVLNKENSMLVASDNPEILARGINKVLVDSALAERISSHAFSEVGRYSWAQRGKNIFNFITL